MNKLTPNIKIYEMFMRDGLQSLKKIYPLTTKIEFMKLLNKCNFDCIEFGSTTNPKLLPQIANSFELYNFIEKKPYTKYTMLIPSFNQTKKVLDAKINSFGLVCSVSETFAKKNLLKSSKETFANVINQMDLITKINPDVNNIHMRVYLSCSFGSPWEDFNTEYLRILRNYVVKLVDYAKDKKIPYDNFDVVIADTVGLSSDERTNLILRIINFYLSKEEKNYLAMHIHSTDYKFHNQIKKCIHSDILKFDSSMCGIGGCPFAEDKMLGNISTIKLIEFLNCYYGYSTNNAIDELYEIQEDIIKHLNSN